MAEKHAQDTLRFQADTAWFIGQPGLERLTTGERYGVGGPGSTADQAGVGGRQTARGEAFELGVNAPLGAWPEVAQVAAHLGGERIRRPRAQGELAQQGIRGGSEA